MPISALPTPPSRQDPTNFNDRADAFLGALPLFQSEANALQTDVNQKQLDATYSATLAAASELAAANTAGATIWVSGTTYSIGANRFSPINFRTYRRKTAGAGTTDPSTDATNWQLLTGLGDTTLQAVYPVGSIYINAGVTTNPATLFGFGTWVAFGAGRVMVGLDATDALFDALGETGGNKDAAVISHTHTATSTVTDPGHRHSASSGNFVIDTGSGTTAYGGAGSNMTLSANTAIATTGISVATSIASTGSSATNANIQPYITVCMWQRTA